MARVKWSPDALDDLDSICEYIGRNSPKYSKIVARILFDLAETIPDSPLRGRIVPEIRRTDIRELFYKHYRLIYWIRKDYIEILNILHGKRLLEINKYETGFD